MKITDLNGNILTVTDLSAAIEQAADIKDYRHHDPVFKEFDDQQQAYWKDLYEKLLQLQSKLKKTKSTKS